MEPSRRIQELKAIQVNEPRPGCWTFDLGQNMVGWVRLKVRGAAGPADHGPPWRNAQSGWHDLYRESEKLPGDRFLHTLPARVRRFWSRISLSTVSVMSKFADFGKA